MGFQEEAAPAATPHPAWAAAILAADLFYLGMRLWGLADSCLDTDEIFSLLAARQDLDALLGTAVRDISHPPLFYLLLKAWIALGGESLLWLRLLPFGLAAATLVPLHGLCRALKLRPWETALALTLLAASSFLLHYACYLRMFVLLQFFAAWNTWLFLRLLPRPRLTRPDGLALFLVNLGLIYSHYWAWVLLGTELLIVLVVARQRLGAVLALGAALALCFSPWAAAVVSAAAGRGSVTAQISWIARPSWPDFIALYGGLHGAFPIPRTTLVGYLLAGIPIVLFGLRARWRPLGPACGDAALFFTLLALAVVPAAVTFGASHVLPQSVWGERQLVIVAAPYAVLLALAACRLRAPVSRTVVPLAVVLWATAAGLTAKLHPEGSLAWDVLAAQLTAAQAAGGPALVYATEAFIATPLDFYAHAGPTPTLAVHVEPDLRRVRDEAFWVAYRDSQWQEARSPQQLLAERGYVLGADLSTQTRTQKVTAFPVRRAREAPAARAAGP